MSVLICKISELKYGGFVLPTDYRDKFFGGKLFQCISVTYLTYCKLEKKAKEQSICIYMKTTTK